MPGNRTSGRSSGDKRKDEASGIGQEAGTALLDLRILATTDLHGHLRGFDYSAAIPRAGIGLSRVATLIAAARKENKNTLLFDNGDFLQGTPLVDFWARERGMFPHEIHPMIAAMNALRYDAGTLGNHEFNFGLDYLKRVIRDVAFPVVASNLHHMPGSKPPAPVVPWTVLDRRFADRSGRIRRLRIGIVGLLPPSTTRGDSQFLAGRISFAETLSSAREVLPRLREAGADLVIALAHCGIVSCPEREDDSPPAPDENCALPLAATEGIDALICGHSHLLFPPAPHEAPALETEGINAATGTLHGKPAVLPGRWGSHLGVIDMVLQEKPDGWRVALSRSALRPVPPPEAPEDPALLRLTDAAHDETLRALSCPLGRLAAPIHSFFPMVAPDPLISLIADAQRDFVRQSLSGRPESALPLLSAIAPSKSGGRGGPGHFVSLPAGPLTKLHIDELYPYPNLIRAVRVTGREIASWLERSAMVFARIGPGVTDQPLLSAEVPLYRFDILDGLTYEIDLSAPGPFSPDRGRTEGPRRIRNIRYRGQPVLPDAPFVVATNNFRTSGAGDFLPPGAEVLPLGGEVSTRKLIADRLRRKGALAPIARPVWRFSPIPGAAAWFDSSPEAELRIAESWGLRIGEIGPTAEGFLRFSLRF